MQHSTDGTIIGQQGVKYGLQKPGALIKKSAVAAAAPKARPNVFGDDDSDDDVEAQVARQAEKKRSAKKVQQVYEQALAEDPSVFDYDGVYDSMQAARVQPRQQEKIARQSKYIAQLKEQANDRKREEEIRYERRLLKERVAEDEQFEGKEKFVTSAYRRKLEEDKKWAEQQQIKDAEDERQDVRKVGHMGNFYSNLLTKNVAMGAGTVKKPSTDTITAGEAAPGQQAAAASAPAVAPAKAGPVLDKYELLRLEAERVRKASIEPEQQGEADQPAVQQESAAADGSGQGDQPAQAVAADVAADVAGQPVAQPLAGKRRNDDTSVMSAKERYLARKKQAT